MNYANLRPCMQISGNENFFRRRRWNSARSPPHAHSPPAIPAPRPRSASFRPVHDPSSALGKRPAALGTAPLPAPSFPACPNCSVPAPSSTSSLVLVRTPHPSSGRRHLAYLSDIRAKQIREAFLEALTPVSLLDQDVPDAYPLSYQANFPLRCVGVLNSTAIRTMSDPSSSGCNRRCMARALGRFFSLLRICQGSVGMSCTTMSADLSISTRVWCRGDDGDDKDTAGQVNVETAPLLSGSIATSVRLQSGFVNSSGNRHVSMQLMAMI